MGSPWDRVPLVQVLGHAVHPGADGAVGDRLPPLCPRAPRARGGKGFGVACPLPWDSRQGSRGGIARGLNPAQTQLQTRPAASQPTTLQAHPGALRVHRIGRVAFTAKFWGPPPPVLLPSAIPCTASPSTPAQILAFSVASPPEGGPCPATQVRINPRGAHPKNPRPRARCGGAGATLPKPFLSAQREFGGFVFCFFLSPPPPPSWSRCLYSFSLPEAEQRGRGRCPSFIHRS